MIPKIKIRLSVINAIGKVFELFPNEISFFLASKPSFQVSKQTFEIGRSNLPIQNNFIRSVEGKRPFAYTRNSLKLIEVISVSIQLDEPVLLVGETGTGKTSHIQYIADQLGQDLIVINLNQQSDSADLLGGFKPVELRSLCVPLKEKFVSLFNKTFSKSSNKKFIEQINTSFAEQKWKRFLTLISQAIGLVEKKIQKEDEYQISSKQQSDSPKRKLETTNESKPMSFKLREEWKKFSNELEIFESQKERITNNFALLLLRDLWSRLYKVESGYFWMR